MVISIIKSFLKWLFIGLLTIFLGVTTALFIFKDRIIDQVLYEVNRSLKTPLEVSSIELEYFHGFPNVAVAFYEVSLRPADRPALQAKRFYILLNLIQIAKGNFIIERLELVGAKITILIDEHNNSNIGEIFIDRIDQEDSLQSIGKESSASFNIQSILLKDIDIEYRSLFSGSSHSWTIDQAVGNLSLVDGIYKSGFKGKVIQNKVIFKTWQSRHSKDLVVDFDLSYNIANKKLEIFNSEYSLDGANFNLSGELTFVNNPKVKLKISGDKISFKHLASYFPPKFEKKFIEYKSHGSIKFKATLVGEISPSSLPELHAKLNLEKVDLTDKSNKANISDLTVEAELDFKDIGDLSSGQIKINSAKGILEEFPFSFNASVENFNRPKFNGDYTGNISTAWLLGYLDFPYSTTGQGHLAVDLGLTGEMDSSGKFTHFDLGGNIGFKDVSFQWADSITIDRIDGSVLFDGDKLSLHDLKINWLDSDLLINGSINAIQSTLDNPDINFLLRSDVRADSLAVEDIADLILFAPVFSDSTAVVANYHLDLELNGQFKALSFKKFHGSDITAIITLEDQFLEIINLNGKGLGGDMKLNGTINQMPNKDIFISARVLTRKVFIDSLFYIFGNFQQDFITNKHLKGRLYADVMASMYFDSTWRLRKNLLEVDSRLRIVEGELNNFEPIMALSEYIDDKNDNLSNLKFSDLVNHIRIRDDTIFIPEMSIHTNVRNIALGGYHTLDQHINYQLAVPIINERVDKDEAFGAVQKSSKGSPNLLFRIKGTTTDYKVNYDLIRASGNVLKLLDITRIFKKKEDIPIDSTFLDDEVFDWDN